MCLIYFAFQQSFCAQYLNGQEWLSPAKYLGNVLFILKSIFFYWLPGHILF